MVLGILCFILGLQVGWFTKQIFNALNRLILSQKQQLSGIVRPNHPQMITPVPKGNGVVKAKSPKQIAIENEQNFRNEFDL